MKKCLLLISMFLYTAISFAQWQPDVRLTNDTSSCYISLNSARCIAINGSRVHIVWSEERDGNREIYYKRSPNNGTNWGPDVRFTSNSSVSWRPSITVNGTTVHTVWCDERDGNFEIYYKRSTDSGISWGPDTRLTYDSFRSWAPSLANNSSVLHVVWAESRDLNEEIYYKRSTDNGINWEPDKRLSNDPFGSFYPSVAVSGSSIHVVWYDFRTGTRAVFYKMSSDGGINWGQDIQLTFNTAQSYNPAVAVSGQIVHVVWHDTRNGSEEIYYKRSSDGGINWGQDTRLTENNVISWYPSISVSGNSIHIAWYDNSTGNYEIYYKRSIDGGISWQQNTQLTNDTAGSFRPSIAVSDSIVHVIWNDNRDGNWEMYYKRNPTGNPIRVENISSVIPSKYSLSQNYPNPFNPKTKIRFSVENGFPIRTFNSEQLRWFGNDKVVLKIYDVMGREIQTLVNERLQPGTYETTFDGSQLTSGVYLYKMYIRHDGSSKDVFSQTKKMMLIK